MKLNQPNRFTVMYPLEPDGPEKRRSLMVEIGHRMFDLSWELAKRATEHEVFSITTDPLNNNPALGIDD